MPLGRIDMTVCQALAVLKAEGLVQAEDGRGVFVRQPPPVRWLAADRFARANRKQGKAAFTAETESESRVGSVDRLVVSIKVPPPEIRERLKLTRREHAVVSTIAWYCRAGTGIRRWSTCSRYCAISGATPTTR